MTESDTIASPSPQTPPAETPVSACPTGRKKWRCWLGMLVMLVLIIAVAGGFFWNHLRFEQLSRTITTNALHNEQIAETVDVLNKDIEQQVSQLADLKQQFLQKTGGLETLTRHWTLVETAYLLQLAAYNSQFQGNAAASLALLKMADQQLASLGDNALMPIRSAIAHDTAILGPYAAVDLPGLLLTLSSLSQSAIQLPALVTHSTTAPAPAATTPPNPSQPQWRQSWDQFWQNLWKKFSSLVTVRHHSQTADALFIAADEAYLTQQLQWLLAQAQWALLHQQPTVFKQSLDSAVTWVNHYYVLTAPETVAFLAQLQQLEPVAQQLIPPSTHSALVAIQALLSKEKQSPVSTPTTLPTRQTP